jgi:hypothetical protein
MSIRCLLWDFGDTLCDELSLWRVSADWMQVYRSFTEEDGIGAAWSLGELTTHEVAVKLAARMPLTEDEILGHLSRIDLFDFFPFTYAFFRARHLPQAVVTVNPAAFRHMAEALSFPDVTDVIVISGEERTVDKGELCRIAVRRMPISCSADEALLIDNKQTNLDAWAAHGGLGYRYLSDRLFMRDVAEGIDGLVRIA